MKRKRHCPKLNKPIRENQFEPLVTTVVCDVGLTSNKREMKFIENDGSCRRA